MKPGSRGVAHRLRAWAIGIAVLGMSAGMSLLPLHVHAQTQVVSQMAPLVVRNDRGGLLRDRLRQIGELRQQGRPVEIRGAVCFSTCTMFLGLPGTCISPRTTFGFHGPSSYGRTLAPDAFNRASRIIASYYPEPLKSWYMDEGRFKIRSINRIKGKQIIDMGVPAC